MPGPRLDEDGERRPRWAKYQLLRQLAWQTSQHLAPNLHVQRSGAY